ncbi:hypothetical protein M758_4G207100 [Ceratodon purpureus]|nr:hypothetical protein M758_4G207100 [Ceratodon purpureus]
MCFVLAQVRLGGGCVVVLESEVVVGHGRGEKLVECECRLQCARYLENRYI